MVSLIIRVKHKREFNLLINNWFILHFAIHAIDIVHLVTRIGSGFLRDESEQRGWFAFRQNGNRCDGQWKSLVVEQRMFRGGSVTETLCSGSEFGVNDVAQLFGWIAFLCVAKETLSGGRSV